MGHGKLKYMVTQWTLRRKSDYKYLCIKWTLPSIFYIKMGKGIAEEFGYGHTDKNDIILQIHGRLSLKYSFLKFF